MPVHQVPFLTMAAVVVNRHPINAWMFSKSVLVFQHENILKRGMLLRDERYLQGDKNLWIYSYFIWKPSYIFLSICSCIILSDFSNYGNRTRKIQTAVHTLTPFLKEKNNKLVVSTPKKGKQRQHANFLCVSYPWHVSFSSLPKVI